jgi:beta-phosphoglucomutase-like phosphatase (HAD superfamily)
MTGIPKLMAQIHAGGLQIGVVTGSGQRPLIDRLLKDFGNYLDINHITTAYDVKRGKPAPDPYLMGLEKAGHLQPWQAIVVENAPLGVRAGVAAQIFTIAVNTGPLPNQALMQEGANLIFNRMTDLSNDWKMIVAEADRKP